MGTAEELRDAILADVTAFRGSSDAADDITVVVARVVPGSQVAGILPLSGSEYNSASRE